MTTPIVTKIKVCVGRVGNGVAPRFRDASRGTRARARVFFGVADRIRLVVHALHMYWRVEGFYRVFIYRGTKGECTVVGTLVLLISG